MTEVIFLLVSLALSAAQNPSNITVLGAGGGGSIAVTPTLIQGPFSTPNDVRVSTSLAAAGGAGNYMLVPLGTNTQVGNTVIALVISASATSNLSVTDDGSSSNSYSVPTGASETAGSHTIAIYTAAITNSSRVLKLTCTAATNCDDNQMVAWEYENLGSFDVACAGTVTSGTSLACSSSISPTTGDLLLAATNVVSYSSRPSGFAASFTAQTGSPTWTLSHAADLDWSASETALAGSGSITPAITVSQAVTRANTVAVAFKASSSGGGKPTGPYLLGMQNQNSGSGGWGFSTTNTSTAQTMQFPCAGTSPFLLVGNIDTATISSVTDNNSNTWIGLTAVNSTGDGFQIQWWYTTNFPATCTGTEKVTVTFSSNPSALIPLFVFFDVYGAASGYDSSATCGSGSTPCPVNTTCSSTTTCAGSTITPSGYPALVLSYQNQNDNSVYAVNVGRFLTATEWCPTATNACNGAGASGVTQSNVGPGLEQDAGIMVDNLASGSAAITWTLENTNNSNVGASFSSTLAVK
jgi:hypothetical protein